MLGIPKFLSTSSGYYVIEHPGATRVLFAQSVEHLLEHLHYPRKITLALPESYFSYGTRDITWKQDTPVTISQLKQQIEHARIEMELQYASQFPYFNYSTRTITQDSLQKSQLLGCVGTLERTLQLSCLRPEYIYMLDIYQKNNIQTDIQLRCNDYLQKHNIQTGVFLLIDKMETQAILLEKGNIVSVHTLNAGYKDFYTILHEHGLTLDQIQEHDMGTMQLHSIEESCTLFFKPIIDRVSSL
jgi:hypothetical protein